MNQFKRAKVVMLPHNNINTIITKYLPNTLSLNNDLLQPHTNQHLYIISDDEIKEGDWVTDNIEVIQASPKLVNSQTLVNRREWKKIIATTDTSLGNYIWKQTNKKSKPYNIQQNIETTKKVFIPLPQPSQQFIEKYIEEYNKGNIITDVLVEYELLGHEEIPSELWEERYKVNPKDNTITIKKIKDSWNREEHINNLRKLGQHLVKCYQNGNGVFIQDVNKWIEENL